MNSQPTDRAHQAYQVPPEVESPKKSSVQREIEMTPYANFTSTSGNFFLLANANTEASAT